MSSAISPLLQVITSSLPLQPYEPGPASTTVQQIANCKPSPAISYNLFPDSILELMEKVKSMMTLSSDVKAINKRMNSCEYVHESSSSKRSNRHLYEGDLSNGLFEGKGRYTTLDRCVYEGNWRKGKLHGKGTFRNQDSSIIYEGNWKYGQRDGLGTLTVADQSYYGKWKGSGLKHIFELHSGKIVYKIQNEHLSLSIFTAYYEDYRYEGELKEGIFHGRGRLYFQSKMIYEGTSEYFSKGSGTFFFSDGSRYMGQWQDGKREGQGYSLNPEGKVIYHGSFSNDRKNGKGTYIVNGTVYEGEWEDDKKEGKGKMTFPSGNTYKGEWANDSMNGIGTLFDSKGNNIASGEWENNQMVKPLSQAKVTEVKSTLISGIKAEKN